jgi:hypothetical protein
MPVSRAYAKSGWLYKALAGCMLDRTVALR